MLRWASWHAARDASRARAYPPAAVKFERIRSEEKWAGKIARVRVDTVRYEDGEESEREVVSHPGAVAVVAHDGERIYLVRQPREPVGEPDLLELPAGKLDEEGESPLDTARRELEEEIGKAAESWEKLATFYSSPGFSDEEVHVYLATDLHDSEAEASENERIEVSAVPLAELDRVIEDCRDAKSLVGLLWFRAYQDGARS
jgi:8-oxo-dGTP pyrophosphatase MutT (NUDIX family)